MGKTSLPDPFEITPKMREWADEKVPTLDIDYYHDEFCDHWWGTGKKMESWVSTWQNWMRRTDRGAAPGLYGPDDKRIVRKRLRLVANPQQTLDFNAARDEKHELFNRAVQLGVNLVEAGRMDLQELRAKVRQLEVDDERANGSV